MGGPPAYGVAKNAQLPGRFSPCTVELLGYRTAASAAAFALCR